MEQKPNWRRPMTQRPKERATIPICSERACRHQQSAKTSRKRKYSEQEQFSIQECVKQLHELLTQDEWLDVPNKTSHMSFSNGAGTFTFVCTSWRPSVPSRGYEADICGILDGLGSRLFHLPEVSMHTKNAACTRSSTDFSLIRDILKVIFAHKNSSEDCVCSSNEEWEPSIKKCWRLGSDRCECEQEPELYIGRSPLKEQRERTLHLKTADTQQDPEHICLNSIMKLKNSLNMDLEEHDIFLANIKSRLTGLERRAEDLTRELERANLLLEEIKYNADFKDIADAKTERDLEQAEFDIWELWDRCKKKPFLWGIDKNLIREKENHVIGHKLMKPSRRNQCSRHSDQTSVINSQARIEDLMQQVNKKIDKIESEITLTCKKKNTIDKRLEKKLSDGAAKKIKCLDVLPNYLFEDLDVQIVLASKRSDHLWD